MLSRRDFIRLGGAAGIAAGCGFASLPLAARPHYTLVASHGEAIFSPEQETPTRVMHYNGSIPGPLLRLAQGRESLIRFENALDEPSSVHWHGLRIDNAMDGVPGMTQAAVQPGEHFDYRLTPPDAGTYWYHTHQRSWAQLALGLSGVLIVDETNPPEFDQDLVFAIDDWRLDDNLQFSLDTLGSTHDWAHAGRMGNVLTVNGEATRQYPVARGERVRLRMVNVANARIMNLLLGERAVSVIAIDGQPVSPYAITDGRIQLAPGQRMDLAIDMTGEPDSRSLIEVIIGEYAYEVASFDYAASAKREQLLETPVQLEANPLQAKQLPDEFLQVPLHMSGGAMGRMQSAIYDGKEMGIRELVRQENKMWAINGIVGLPEEPLFRVKRGTAVSLEVTNDNRWPHAMHLHGHHFIEPGTPGIWRDTFLFNQGQEGSMQFIADNPGKWLVHCHMVEHMAGGMSAWFEVT